MHAAFLMLSDIALPIYQTVDSRYRLVNQFVKYLIETALLGWRGRSMNQGIEKKEQQKKDLTFI
jgi:hypothetical protein